MNITNILYLHETSRIAGAEYSLLNLVKNIDKTRFDPIFVLPEPGPLSEELAKAGIEVLFIPFPKVRALAGVFRAFKKLARVVKEKDIRIIHSNSIRTHLYGSAAGREARVPVVWHERNLIANELIDPERSLSFLPDRIICNSGAIARRFMRRGALPAKVTVVHNGVDTGLFSPSVNGQKVREGFGVKADETVVGIASRFHRSKGHETFFEAAKILLRDMPQRRLKFLVAGGAVFDTDKEREARLKDLAAVFPLNEAVVFTGLRKDMPEVYAATDLFVLASDAEACGRVIIEAMASGKPVVGTDSGGTPEIIEDGVSGILVAPGKPKAMAEALAMLINDRSKRTAMGLAGRKRAESLFSIGSNVRKIENIYAKLLEGR
ncbi:MAG: glycosyltransferase [Candidatus Omnitrophica bacterium]|nr:glycosyltransferase [Candidatus Omnitrophota bacterium]